jgi:DNA repair exonuclease SbcCD ATPase subunit
MNIISLRASNVKRLTAVSIDPSGALVRITGANGAGKSSVLDCIWYGLGGESVIPSEPVRDGEEKAEITLTLGTDGVMKYRVTRKITRGKTSQLLVENADGARFPSPQKFLDKLYGSLTFDPEVFGRMSPKQQVEQLKALANIDVDLDALKRENDADYARRTDINRRAKSLKETLDLYAGGLALDMDVTPINVDALLREIDAAAKANGDIRARMDEYNRFDAAIQGNLNEAERLRQEARRLIEKADGVEAANDGLRRLRDATVVNPGGAPDTIFGVEVNVADITRQVQDATRENSARDLQRQQREKYQSANEAWLMATRESDALTARMDERTKQARDAIAAAKMPVDGLTLGESDVLYKGLPFSQASSAERLRVSFQMAMALAPELKIVRIQNGSLLDSENLAMISALAEERGFQVWVEIVSESGDVGIYLEEGEIISVDGVPVPDATAQ